MEHILSKQRIKEIEEYWFNRIYNELGELDSDDKEVLECSIEFNIASESMGRML